MRILAVIPACEGSTVFPNKNMRVIQGKPLIYYALRNALQSAFVTDVIVTSNSNEILSLARQMGAQTRKRREELCNTMTSLDVVVWDVFEQLELACFDYVVTMQPISPTLKAETLDAAFERILSEDDDTLISVRKQAQYYWKIREGKPIPNQRERVNRNQLPPFYIETGAFLITKAACIRPESRIGEKVGLFELKGDESIDINNFGDLRLAESALMRKETAIYVNGNEKIGLGHITRMLQIADELFVKPDFYYDENTTNPECFGNTTYNLIPVAGETGFLQAVNAHSYDLIINDVLDTSENYMQKLRESTKARIVNFEDNGAGARFADLVFNALYENSESHNVATGSRYYIIPKLFLIYPAIEIRKNVKKVIITFGGADPENYTEVLLNIATQKKYRYLHFFVVFGRANQHTELLDGRFEQSNITILQNIDNMAEIMAKCDAAVTSRGRTCFELAALGIPTLSIPQHKREEMHTFVRDENGFLCLGARPNAEIIERAFDKFVNMSQKARSDCQRMMLKNDLRNGRRNVVDKILML